MFVEENQNESAPIGRGGVAIDVTTFFGVEPYSFVAARDRFPSHLKNCYSTACPGDIQGRTETLAPMWAKMRQRVKSNLKIHPH